MVSSLHRESTDSLISRLPCRVFIAINENLRAENQFNPWPQTFHTLSWKPSYFVFQDKGNFQEIKNISLGYIPLFNSIFTQFPTFHFGLDDSGSQPFNCSPPHALQLLHGRMNEHLVQLVPDIQKAFNIIMA